MLISADNVADALQRIQATPPHLVICDISLSNSSGIDLIKGLTKAMPELRILVLSF
jgi:YesN/AraC family two-component response regulator